MLKKIILILLIAGIVLGEESLRKKFLPIIGQYIQKIQKDIDSILSINKD